MSASGRGSTRNGSTLPIEVPPGWKPITWGAVLRERLERARPSDELLSVTAGRGLIRQSEGVKRDTSSSDKSKYKRVYAGDIVYNTMRMWQGVSSLSHYEGIVSPAYTVLAPIAEVEPRFIAALLKHPHHIARFHAYAQGLVDDTLNLKYPTFSLLPACIPIDPDEQRRIADALETLEAAHAAGEGVLQKLRRIKAGALHDLLTRGLDQSGRLRDPITHPEQFKDSELERIPKDWEIGRIGELFETQLGKMLSKAAKNDYDSFVYLANRNVQWDYVDLSNLETMDFSISEREKFLLKPNDLLVCEGGEIGRTALWRGEIENCFYQKAVHRLRPKSNRIEPKFMLRFMHFAVERGVLTSYVTQTSISHLTKEMLELVPVLLPKRGEQIRIAEILDDHDARIQAEESNLSKLDQMQRGLREDLLMGRK